MLIGIARERGKVVKRTDSSAPILELGMRHRGATAFARLPRQHVEASRSANGRPRRNAALTMVKPIALMPMPSASTTIAAAENQRSFAIRRKAKRTSCTMLSSAGRPRVSRCCCCDRLRRRQGGCARLGAPAPASCRARCFRRSASRGATPAPARSRRSSRAAGEERRDARATGVSARPLIPSSRRAAATGRSRPTPAPSSWPRPPAAAGRLSTWNRTWPCGCCRTCPTRP